MKTLDEYDDLVWWLTCGCGGLHLISAERLDALWLDAVRARSAAPVQLDVAAVAPFAA